MPVTYGVGHSVATAAKQEALRYILRVHIRIAGRIVREKQWAHGKYLWADLTAGSGYLNGEPGSPAIFFQEMERMMTPYTAVFAEKRKQTHDRLQNFLRKRTKGNGHKVEIRREDNKKTAEYVAQHAAGVTGVAYGMVYIDNNGQPPWDVVVNMAQKKSLQRVDLLLNIPCTSVKRSLSYSGHRLTDRLASIEKRYWLVREPIPQDGWQWSFLLGTNWPDFPEFAALGMYRAESKRGQEIIHYLNTTNAEKGA